MVGLLLPLLLAQKAPSVSVVGQIQIAALNECSGLVRSRVRGRFWAHNDSGDSARIFAIRADGRPFGSGAEVRVANAKSVDWEDITGDGRNLYVADTGNNGNARRDLTVYAVREPGPDAKTATPWAAWRIAYPDQREFPPPTYRNFDCEAVYWHRGRLHFLTKWRLGPFPAGGTTLYRLDRPQPGITNKLTKIGTVANLPGWVTAADVSPDGKTLAVLTHLRASVCLFDARAANPLAKPLRTIMLPEDVGQVEALAFENDGSLLIASEEGIIRRLKI